MTKKRGKMGTHERDYSIKLLSCTAVATFVVLLLISNFLGIFLWAGYWIIGIPATKFSLWLFDVTFEVEYDATIIEGEYEGLRVALYLLWVFALPLLVIAAFVTTLFRAAIRLID